MSKEYFTKCLVIGSGPAGYTASIYAARANLNPLHTLGLDVGGQLTTTTDVENYPGFAQVIQGPWLMEQMHQQAVHVGVTMLHDTIVSLDLSTKPFKAWTETGALITASTIILATGARAKWLGLESETAFKGFGVSGCATCDGFFYKGKRVAVIGGGNAAIEEALYLTNHATQIFLIHRRNELRGEKILQQRLLNHPKITVIWDHVVDEILGTHSPKSVTGLSLKNVQTGELQTLQVQGVFVAIGHSPASSLVRGVVDTDNEGYVITKPNSMSTNIPGFFAAGDVQDTVFRQAITAAGQGCMAALEAERFLSSTPPQVKS